MTTNELATRPGGSDLAIEADQTFWSPKQLAALQQLGMRGASNGDLAVFFHQATRTGLDPFARQIYMIERQGKQTIQTGIDGFRLIARRTTDRSGGTFGYEETLWCGEDAKWVDVWLKRESPRAAKVTVIRDGQRYPAVALWDEYVGTKRSGEITQMWATKGALMLAKCAEALALRRAFPQDLSGIYTSEEMQQADIPGAQQTTPAQANGADRVRQVLGTTSQTGNSEGSPAETSVAGGEAGSSPAGNPSELSPEPITAGQIKKMGVAMREADLTDRDDALAYVASVIDRTVASRNELTKDEASRVIDALGRGATAAEDVVDAEIVEESPPAPPAAADADPDPDAIWQQILKAAHEKHTWGLSEVAKDFMKAMGMIPDEATGAELAAYLHTLVTGEEPAA